MPHKKIDRTPYETWKGHAPNIKSLKVWGCLVKVGVPDPQKIKIGPMTVNSIFIGYARNSMAYRFILIHDNGVLGVIHESTDDIFFKCVPHENLYSLHIAYNNCITC